jgi:tRNA U34 2-thiouridine synthase MnmA/TrmU
MKAVSLLSGGLDSTLATKMIKEMGLDVIALNFTSPFCQCGGKQKDGCKNKAVEMAEQIGVELKMINPAAEFIEVVKNPKHGYGSGANPCIDCRILKFKLAKKYMEEIGASFIITGEVLGQRPMSQNSRALKIIETESGLDGLILRPLCAGVMEPSIPEQKGWIDRSKLRSIEGRSRGAQLDMVEEFKILNHACPAGGCLLTDKHFAAKVMDLIASGMFDVDNSRLFVFGRYFKVSKKFKLAVGRNAQENAVIKNFAAKGDLVIEAGSKGPTALGRGELNDDNRGLAMKIVAHYCRKEEPQEVRYSVYGAEEGSAHTDSIEEIDPSAFVAEDYKRR